LLVDSFYIPHVRGLRRKNQLAIVRGDEKSYSIAAASIIAKVYRDNLIEKIGLRRIFLKYEWYKNKGYGTKKHREAILKYGLTNHHRLQFVKTFLSRG
jgi:ribonuclease HII